MLGDTDNKIAANQQGRYFVDDQCTGCGLCVAVAPDNFRMQENVAFVYHQPENNDQENSCEDAMQQCPVNAIGNDGAEQ